MIALKKDVKTIVNNLVNKYDTRDPFKLCDYTNTIYKIGDIGEVLGCYLLIKRQKCIMLNQKIAGTPMEKFVLSHELGHSQLHWKNDCYFYGSTFFSKNKEENEANTFASELLIPDYLIYENPGMTRGQIARLAGYDEKIMEFKKLPQKYERI